MLQYLYSILYFWKDLSFLLVAIAYLTLVERKMLGSVQRRRGPNDARFWINTTICGWGKTINQRNCFPP